MIEENTSLRSLYRPLQPTVKEDGEAVAYSEVRPHLELDDFIYCYWRLHTRVPLDTAFRYRVVADGCIDLFFEAGDPSENYVVGLSQEYMEFPLEKEFDYYGIRFLPSRFPLLFQVDASTFSDHLLLTAELVPSLATFVSGLPSTVGSLSSMQDMFDDHFRESVIAQAEQVDPRFEKALLTILSDTATQRLSAASDYGLSSRQLRRLFNYYVGAPPKKFSRIIRFQQMLDGDENADRRGAFYDAGYFDQAHYIKEFKRLYGTTPKRSER